MVLRGLKGPSIGPPLCLFFSQGINLFSEGRIKLHSKKHVSESFQIARNVIVVTVFLLIMNQTELCSLPNQQEGCQYDHMPLDLKGITNRFFLAQDENTPR